MSIIDIISIGIHTVALTQDGYLLTWNLSPASLNRQVTKDFPYLQNDFQYKILDTPALSLIKSKKNIYICGLKQIKVIEITELENFIKKYKNKDNKYQLSCKIFKEQHGIQTVLVIQNRFLNNDNDMIDQSKQNQQYANQSSNNPSNNYTILYSTKLGKIHSISPNFKETTLICDITTKQIHNLQNNQSHNIHNNSGSIIGWSQYATSMIAYRDNCLLLVGTSAGRILIVNLVGNKIVENVTMRNNLKIGAVDSLVLSASGHRFYSLHSNCIVEWSMQMQKCLGFYTYSSPYSLLDSQKLCSDSSKILISGGSRFIDVINTQNSSERSQIQTNLQSIHVMKQINNKIYCGGYNSMIEILQLGVTQLLLYRNQQDVYF